MDEQQIEPLWDGWDGARRLKLPNAEAFWRWVRLHGVPVVEFSSKTKRVRPTDVEEAIRRLMISPERGDAA